MADVVDRRMENPVECCKPSPLGIGVLQSRRRRAERRAPTSLLSPFLSARRVPRKSNREMSRREFFAEIRNNSVHIRSKVKPSLAFGHRADHLELGLVTFRDCILVSSVPLPTRFQ